MKQPNMNTVIFTTVGLDGKFSKSFIYLYVTAQISVGWNELQTLNLAQ